MTSVAKLKAKLNASLSSCGRRSTGMTSFAKDKCGNISIIAGFALLPLFAAAGMAVDYGRAHYVKSRMQTSLDAAVLAGGRTFQLTSSSSDADAAARNFFNHRFAESSGLFGQPQITGLTIDTSAYTITATASTAIPTPFLGIAGTPSIQVSGVSKSALSIAGNGQDKELEISMVLDVTGSMADATSSGNSKIHDAKLAAKDLVDIVLPTGFEGSNKTRIALVPFSQYVNVGSYYQTVTNQAASGGNTCVTERTGDDAYTDKKPGSNRWIGAFTSSSNHSTNNCTPTVEVTPLTNDKAALKATIDTYSASGWTAGHLGTAWGWYMLSHDWHDVWPVDSQPKSGGNIRKVTVIMTDGDYNTYYRNGVSSQDQAEDLCTAMKADITVYTIGFGTDMSQSAKDFLKACASSPSHYFDATDGNDLRNAFRSIAISLSQLRLTQ